MSAEVEPDPNRDATRDGAAAPDPRLGAVLAGRYRLERLVGKGGMGRVYRATQFPLNRSVAVKILNPEFQKKDPQFVRRFFLEAATTARLTHPNTITVFDYGEAESGELFIAMEYLKGQPLSRVIAREGPLPAERALHIALQICRALREAHGKGIIHRDLKPGNIMLLEGGDDPDFVKVLDFGLVKLFTPVSEPTDNVFFEPPTPGMAIEGEVTRAGMFLGSPKYMSPEQIQGMHLDPRTDIYAVGVLMFQMISGRPPFIGSTSVEVIYKHVNLPVPSIAEVAPSVEAPEELERAICECLAKNRDHRFSSMNDLILRLKDVRRAITGVTTGSESDFRLTDDVGALAGDAAHRSSRPSSRPVSVSPRSARPVARIETLEPEPTPAVRPAPREDAPPGPLANTFTRAAPVVAGAALVVVLGVFAYVISSPPPALQIPAAETPPVAADAVPVDAVRRSLVHEVRVTFASSPEGADVYEGGVLLGTTPFVRHFDGKVVGAGYHRFVFKRKDHLDEVVEERLVDGSVKIHARLRGIEDGDGRDAKGEGARARKAPPKKRSPESSSGSGSEYKENPY